MKRPASRRTLRTLALPTREGRDRDDVADVVDGVEGADETGADETGTEDGEARSAGVARSDAPARDAGDDSVAGTDASHEIAGYAASASAERRADRSGSARSRSGKARRPGGQVGRVRARRLARERTVQALYQWDLADDAPRDVRRQFLDRQPMDQVDREYFVRTFDGATGDREAIDARLDEALDRPLVDVDPIERAVLRLAVFELVACLDTPARVVINEAIEITRRYGADRGHAYVNAVLDRMLVGLRPHEGRQRR